MWPSIALVGLISFQHKGHTDRTWVQSLVRKTTKVGARYRHSRIDRLKLCPHSIKEWAGMGFAITNRAAEDRTS